MAQFVAKLNEYQLSYTKVGRNTSPPIVLIHDLMSHRGVWQETMEVLKLSHQCVALDLLGFGDSPKPQNVDYSIEAQSKRVLELIDKLGFDHFDLMGHSMGGQIASFLAARLAPERINRLIIVDGIISGRLTPWVERVTLRQIETGAKTPFLYNWAYRLCRSSIFGRLIFYPWFYDFEALPYEDWQLDRQMACQPTIFYSAYQSWISAHTTDLTDELSSVKSQTLIIFGQQDGTVPVSEGLLAKTHIPDSRLVLIDQCGHLPMYEQRDQYLDALLAFFR